MPQLDHTPVLLGEVLEYLAPQPGETILDCTFGRGGHARKILPALSPDGRYVGLDLDRSNIDFAREIPVPNDVRLDAVHANFDEARRVLDELQVDRADGLLADIGFSSTQMDDAARGFSFMQDGPLDMRMNPDAKTTASDLVNRLSERELADVIFQYGEERYARRIARKIVDQRAIEPIQTTGRLASLCASAAGCAGRRVSRIHPATRTFQALRIAVNDELGNLQRLLESLPQIMAPGGRAVFISFHSLEDRPVKQALARYAAEGRAERLTKKPVTAGDTERAANRRSRSAKLRAIHWRDTDEGSAS